MRHGGHGHQGGSTSGSSVIRTVSFDEVFDSRDSANHLKGFVREIFLPDELVEPGESVLVNASLSVEGETGVSSNGQVDGPEGSAWIMSEALWLRDHESWRSNAILRRTRSAYHNQATSNGPWISLHTTESQVGSNPLPEQSTPAEDADNGVVDGRIYIRFRYGETQTDWRLRGAVSYFINRAESKS